MNNQLRLNLALFAIRIAVRFLPPSSKREVVISLNRTLSALSPTLRDSEVAADVEYYRERLRWGCPSWPGSKSRTHFFP